MSQIQPIISLSQVTKSYYLSNKVEIPVLKWIDLTIAPGEFVALMWHSGSGKSTLLNIIWLLHPLGGWLYELEWEDISNYTDDYSASYIRNRKIGFIFQSYFLIQRMSALDNVILPTLYANLSPEERIIKAKSYLEQVGLWDKMYNKPSEMSWWQQQRVAIARALINEPDIILADEPTWALDQQTGKEIMDLVTALNKQWKTIIMVTHDAHIAEYASRIIYLKDGLVVDHDYKLTA